MNINESGPAPAPWVSCPAMKPDHDHVRRMLLDATGQPIATVLVKDTPRGRLVLEAISRAGSGEAEVKSDAPACAQCHDRGIIEINCDRCLDSTDDHICDESTVYCLCRFGRRLRQKGRPCPST